MPNSENSGKFFQYANTILLSLIFGFALIIYLTLTSVRDVQNESAKELVRMKTVQDINTANIKDLDARVTTLERNYLEYIKTWTDANYIRKPQ